MGKKFESRGPRNNSETAEVKVFYFITTNFVTVFFPLSFETAK